MNLLYLVRWNSQFYSYSSLAILMWQMFVSHSQMLLGLLFIYVIWFMMLLWNHVGIRGSPRPGVVDCYLSFSSGDLTRTSSHLCGSWYLPMFLFMNESLTLINIASLMALAIFWSSLSTTLKLSRESSWPVMLWGSWMGHGASICSLNLFAKVLPDSPIYSSSQSTLPHLYL